MKVPLSSFNATNKLAEDGNKLHDGSKSEKQDSGFRVGGHPLCQTFKRTSSSEPESVPGTQEVAVLEMKSPAMPSTACDKTTPLRISASNATSTKLYTKSLLYGNSSVLQKTSQMLKKDHSFTLTPKFSNVLNSFKSPPSHRRLNSELHLDIPLTPFINDYVKSLTNYCRGSSRPHVNDASAIDFLQIIDDDSTPVEAVEHHIHRVTELTVVDDHNIADFLLDISEDYNTPSALVSRTALSVIQPLHKSATIVDGDDHASRKCRRAKPVCLEGCVQYQEQRKARQRDRKKRRQMQFLTESSGARKSERNADKKKKYRI